MPQALLRGPRRALLTPDVAGWTPADLGSDLLGWWDAGRLDTITLSGSSVTSWRDLVASYDAVQAVGSARPRWSAQAFGGYLNKCSNTNANPQTNAGLTITGDAAMVVTQVDDRDELAAAGLEGFGPRAYRADNTAGTGLGFVTFNGTVGNLNQHFGAIWLRGAGTGSQLRSTGNGSEGTTNYSLAPTYARVLVDLNALASTARSLQLWIAAGAVVYFTANGLYEGSSAPPVDVIVQGGTAYGYGAPGLVFDGVDDELTLASVPFPVGAAGSELWALVDQQAIGSDTTNRRSFSYGGGGNIDSRQLYRGESAGVSRARVIVGSGAAQQESSVNTVDFSGRHVMRGIVGPTESVMQLNAEVGAPASIVPATGAVRTRIGATPAVTPSGFWRGQVAVAIVTNPLDAGEAANMLAYLTRRGGI